MFDVLITNDLWLAGPAPVPGVGTLTDVRCELGSLPPPLALDVRSVRFKFEKM